MSTLFILRKIVIILTILLIAIFFYSYSAVFMPIFLALFTALLFEPLVKLFQKYMRTEKRLLAVSIIFILFVLSISITTYVTLTKLINQVLKWIYQLPQYVVEIQNIVDRFIEEFHVMIVDIPQNHLLIQELEKQSQWLTDKAYSMAQNVIPILSTWVQAIPNLIIGTLIYLISLFLISLDLPRLVNMFYLFFKEETARKIKYVFERLGKVFTGFIKAQLLVSMIIFVVTYIGLLFIVPQQALLMAVIIWIIDVIPFIGSIIVMAPWIIYVFIAGDPSMGIQLSILAFVLFILRRTLEPKIMGDQIGLSALPTLLSIYFGLYFLGVIGLVLGPLLVIAVKSAVEAEMFKLNMKI